MLSVVAFRILYSQPLVDVHCSPTAMVVYKRIASLIAGEKKNNLAVLPCSDFVAE